MKETEGSTWWFWRHQFSSEWLVHCRLLGILSEILSGSLRHYGKDLVEAWDARGKDYKFTVVCIVHHAAKQDWEELFAPLARRGALRLLPISDQYVSISTACYPTHGSISVSRAFLELLKEFASSSDPIFRSAGFEHVLSDVHVPILNISTLSRPRNMGRLANVVIQGSFDPKTRDYFRIFEELIEALSSKTLILYFACIGF